MFLCANCKDVFDKIRNNYFKQFIGKNGKWQSQDERIKRKKKTWAKNRSQFKMDLEVKKKIIQIYILYL